MCLPAAPGGPGDFLPPAAGASPTQPSTFLTGSIKHVSFRGKEEPLTFNASNRIAKFEDFEDFVKDKMKIPKEDKIDIQIEGYNPETHWKEFAERVSSGDSAPIETMYIEQVASASISPKEGAAAVPKAPAPSAPAAPAGAAASSGPPRVAVATPVTPPTKPATPFLTGTLYIRKVGGGSRGMDMAGIKSGADLEARIKEAFPGAIIFVYNSCEKKLADHTQAELQQLIDNSGRNNMVKILMPKAAAAAAVPSAAAAGTPAGVAAAPAPPKVAVATPVTPPAKPATPFLTGTLYISKVGGGSREIDLAGIKSGADLEARIKEAFPGAIIFVYNSCEKKLADHTQAELQQLIVASWRNDWVLKILMPKTPAAVPSAAAAGTPAGVAASSASPAPEETPPIVVTPPPLDRRAARPPSPPSPETPPPQEKSTFRTFWESIWPS